MNESRSFVLDGASKVEAASNRFWRELGQRVLLLLFLSPLLNAAPVEVFLSRDLKLPEAPARFWGGETAELRIFSNMEVSEPVVYALSKALSTPLELETQLSSSGITKSGLYLHQFSFTAPATRSKQQRYLLRYEEAGLTLHFDVYPQWLREQVMRKAEAYMIQINEPTSQARDFFQHFQSEAPNQQKRPILQIIHSEQDVLIQRSRNKVIWKTDFNQLDVSDPAHTLRFEAVLDTLNDLNQE